jgi:hypothetical protein
MSFTESNTVEAHLRDLLAGAALTRFARFSAGVAIDGMHLDLSGQV